MDSPDLIPSLVVAYVVRCVDLVSARPGVGKSVFADNVALHNARLGVPVLMLKCKDEQEDTLNRILANIDGIAIGDVATSRRV